MGGGAGRISISHDYYSSHSNTEHSYAQKRFQKSTDAAQMDCILLRDACKHFRLTHTHSHTHTPHICTVSH